MWLYLVNQCLVERAICFGGSSQCSDSAQPRGTGRRSTGAESFRQPGVHNPRDYSIGRRGTHMFSNNTEVPHANECLQTWLSLARVMRSCLLLLRSEEHTSEL